MPSNFKRSTLAVSTEADAVCARLDGGMLDIYSGEQPSDADAKTSGPLLLARLRFQNPAFAPAANGVARARPLNNEEAALATGLATWFRATTRTGIAIFDGSIGTSDVDCVLTDPHIRQGGRVAVVSMEYIAPKEAA